MLRKKKHQNNEIINHAHKKKRKKKKNERNKMTEVTKINIIEYFLIVYQGP